VRRVDQVKTKAPRRACSCRWSSATARRTCGSRVAPRRSRDIADRWLFPWKTRSRRRLCAPHRAPRTEEEIGFARDVVDVLGGLDDSPPPRLRDLALRRLAPRRRPGEAERGRNRGARSASRSRPSSSPSRAALLQGERLTRIAPSYDVDASSCGARPLASCSTREARAPCCSTTNYSLIILRPSHRSEARRYPRFRPR